MQLHIVLDSTPLGLLTVPTPGTESVALLKWASNCQSNGHKIYIPEIVDYEIRRELLRAGKQTGLAKLNAAKAVFHLMPIDGNALNLAASLWAAARNGGYATGHPERLDIDVILAAQALLLPVPAGSLIVATSNVRHLSRFVAADEWHNINP